MHTARARKPPNRNDVNRYLEQVPDEHKAGIKQMSMKMLSHPAYNQP